MRRASLLFAGACLGLLGWLQPAGASALNRPPVELAKEQAEFIEECATSACCDAGAVPAARARGNFEPPSEGTSWTFVWGGAEQCFKGKWNPGFEPTALEEEQVVAFGQCLTYNTHRSGDNHSHLTPTRSDACVHGTVFRVSDADLAKWLSLWSKYGYDPIPINVTTIKSGRNLAAVVPVLAEPLLDRDAAHEAAPKLDYIRVEYCEMRHRSYCPAFLAATRKHLEQLGAAMDQLNC